MALSRNSISLLLCLPAHAHVEAVRHTVVLIQSSFSLPCFVASCLQPTCWTKEAETGCCAVMLSCGVSHPRPEPFSVVVPSLLELFVALILNPELFL